MKNCQKILFTYCLLILCLHTTAQNATHFFKSVPILSANEPNWVTLMYSDNPCVPEVVEAYETYYKKHSFQKNIHTQNYKHWLKSIALYVNDEGYIELNNTEREIFVANLLKKRKQENLQKSNDIWSCIGPLETYADDSNLGVIPVSWQVNVYCMDQSASNPNVLYAGTEGQGAWKTTDKGLNWSLITKNEDIGGVSDIKVAATNENLVYLAGGGEIYKSTDGGDSWLPTYAVNNIYQIVIHPTNHNIVLAVGANGLLRTTDGGANWVQLFTEKCWDINFHPNNSNIVYLLRHNSSLQYTEFHKSTDAGANWTQITHGSWYNPVNPSFTDHIDYGALIAVTPLEPNKVYVGMMGNHKADDNVWIGVYKSEDEGETWVNPIQDGGPYDAVSNPNLATSGLTGGFSQTFYNFAFDVSHTVPGKLYLGVLALSVSEDDGNSWTRIGAYSATNDVGWIHPDIQDLHVQGNDVWMACDGGINYSNDEFATHESRKNGLAGAHFWGFAQAWNEDILVGGRYHNGNTALYEVYGIGNATRLGGAESPTGYVDLLHPRTTYFSDISTRVIDPSFVGQYTSLSSLSKYPHQSYFHADNSEIVRDPRYAHHLYIGSASTDTQDGGFWKSTDNGNTFELLHNFGSAKVTGIEISRQDPNVLYCVYDGSAVYKTTDGGYSWIAAAPLPSAGNKMISINPNNDQELWVFAHTNNNTNKVFRTIDGGNSWQNMTTPTLNGYRINDGFFQGGSINGRVYVVAAYGLFYWDNATNDWVDYHAGLPFVMGDVKHVFQAFYRDDKIRLSSVRGIWEAPFEEPSQPLAYPMTKTDTIFCSRDTIQLDCHSILNHEGASWNWNITPAPLYISSNESRNPKILLEDDTSYDVTLTVTNALGQSSSKTIANMISVQSRCEADTVAGQALSIVANPDYVVTPPFNMFTNTLTITAWVKLNGIQPDYSSIVMNDGSNAAGFNFREGNNTLAYHWPGGAWWWDSNLEVPTDEWTHVAMVATPTAMTLYMNGVGVTHTTSLSETDLSSFKIGSYRGWSSRNMNGEIDEVCFWSSALSASEIRANMHLTKEDVLNDSNLIAYYQFNETGSEILDKKGLLHANLNGNATKVVSTAPVGGGISETLSVTIGGTYTASTTGLQITFPNIGTLPNGDIVINKINVAPHNLPGTTVDGLQEYWIINNYGSDQSISTINNMILQPIYTPVSPQHSNATLISRLFNGHTSDSWSSPCLNDNIIAGANGNYSFATTCGINNISQQFYIDTNCPSPCVSNIEAKILLEGAYLGSGLMTTNLLEDNLLPYSQPFNTSPWNYTGNEKVINFPNNVTDWILIEARHANDLNTTIEQRAAFVRNDGILIDTDGNEGINFYTLDENELYHFIIRSRNHLAVMSNIPISVPTNNYYNFTIAGSEMGTEQTTVHPDGNTLLITGDYNADGVISVVDFNDYSTASSLINSYTSSDGNLDGTVSVADFNLYSPNASKIGINYIRY